jgi:phosphatidate phosphatase APP1
MTTGCSRSRVLLAGEDMVVPPRSKVDIRAKLEERNLFLKDIEKTPIHFRLKSGQNGSTISLEEERMTGENGMASISLQMPEKEGLYKIDVFYDGNHRFESQNDEVRVLVIKTDKPVAILDIDHTLTSENWLRQPEEIDPYDKDTVRVVNELAKKYVIVYLSSRPRLMHRSTHHWLNNHGFPDGPILLWSPKKISWFEPEEYKKDILESLRKSGITLAVGIGNREADIEAYRETGMRAILLAKTDHDRNEAEEEGGIAVSGWAEIETILSK